MPDAAQTASSESVQSNIQVTNAPQANSSTVLAPRSTIPSAALESDGALQDDPNPRSPKRRRTSPPSTTDDFDIEAAAERALASALGADLGRLTSAAPTSNGQQNGTTQAPLVQQQQQQQPPPLPPPVQVPPSRQMRVENLAHLNDSATEILSFLARLNHLEIGEVLFGPPTPRGHEYRAIKAKFEQAKRMYLMIPPFLSPQALDLLESGQIDIVRKTNLATFMASIFSGELGLRVMDMSFIDIFVPDGGRILKPQASIYLELKTQAFIAAAKTAPSMLNQVMVDLFPPDMDKTLLQKRPGAKTLAPAEQDFIKRLASRRDILWSHIRAKTLNTVYENYSWNGFAREVSLYLTKYMENLNSGGSKDKSNDEPLEYPGRHISQGQLETQFPIHRPSLSDSQSAVASLPAFPSSSSGVDFSIDDFVAQAARAVELSMGGNPDIMFPLPSLSQNDAFLSPVMTPAVVPAPVPVAQTQQEKSPPLQPQVQTEFKHYDPTGSKNGDDDTANGDVPHSSQTAPTQVLYERARQVTKGSPSTRKIAPPSNRRPWTTEEENALMTGLDQVKGPHWSQILAMYGPGGTIDESLKDRNQVQLKDKARNLKLFFLKAGIEVPYYLQAVTGDLKTRAPGQAEKMERERELGDSEGINGSQASAESPEPTDPDFDEVVTSPQNPYQEADKQELLPEATALPDNSEFDMEAMIAKAAAQAGRDFNDHTWP